MFCPECGTETEGKFCPKCGTSLITSEKDLAPVEPTPIPKAPAEGVAPTNKYSVNEFISKTMQKEGTETFELENKYLLDVNLNGRFLAKKGAMVAYTGDVKFRRQSSLEQGLEKFVKKAVTGEASTMMKVKGHGHVYLADKGKEIVILKLENERIYVNGNDVLAFEDTIDWDIKMMSSAGVMSGGLFNIRLEGTGMVAITTHYTPITLRVTPDQPIYTDPNATVAWSGGLSPTIKADVDFKTLLGKDSGETFQMKFQGNGFVIVQPFEEI